jgi:hypothetical protein
MNSSDIYKAARIARDIEVLSSGDPKKIGRRVRNRIVGRLLARAGVWNKLWGKW